MINDEIEDNELLYMIHQKDEAAFRSLVKKYDKDIRRVIASYMRMNYRFQDADDFYQLALLKLMEAADGFKPGICRFRSFYFNVLRHALIDMLRKMNANNEKKEWYALSLDMRIEDQKGSYTLLEMVEIEKQPDDERSEGLYQDMKAIHAKLNILEQQILQLRLSGHTYKQIAAQLHVTTKKVDNTLRKIRKVKKNGVSD